MCCLHYWTHGEHSFYSLSNMIYALLTAKSCWSYSYSTGLHNALPVCEPEAARKGAGHSMQQPAFCTQGCTHTCIAEIADMPSNYSQHLRCLSNCHSFTETALAIAASLRAHQTRMSQVMQVAAEGQHCVKGKVERMTSPYVLQWWRCRCADPCQH